MSGYSSQYNISSGEFCSRHRDAVDIYKYYLQHDARFGQFVRHCQSIPLLKKKGIPECILFVTQRLTKYPLLIEPLIKTSKDNKEEQELLQKALALVKVMHITLKIYELSDATKHFFTGNLSGSRRSSCGERKRGS